MQPTATSNTMTKFANDKCEKKTDLVQTTKQLIVPIEMNAATEAPNGMNFNLLLGILKAVKLEFQPSGNFQGTYPNMPLESFMHLISHGVRDMMGCVYRIEYRNEVVKIFLRLTDHQNNYREGIIDNLKCCTLIWNNFAWIIFINSISCNLKYNHSELIVQWLFVS